MLFFYSGTQPGYQIVFIYNMLWLILRPLQYESVSPSAPFLLIKARICVHLSIRVMLLFCRISGPWQKWSGKQTVCRRKWPDAENNLEAVIPTWSLKAHTIFYLTFPSVLSAVSKAVVLNLWDGTSWSKWPLSQRSHIRYLHYNLRQ